MWNFDRHERDVCFAIFFGDDRRDFFVGLKLDDKINFLLDKKVGVALGDLRVVLIVDDDKLDAFGRGGALKACADFFSESILGALRGVSESIQLLLERTQAGLIEILADFFNHSALFKRVEHSKYHAFGQTAALGEFAKRKHFASRSEGAQQLRRMHDRFDEVWIASGQRF